LSKNNLLHLHGALFVDLPNTVVVGHVRVMKIEDVALYWTIWIVETVTVAKALPSGRCCLSPCSDWDLMMCCCSIAAIQPLGWWRI